MDAQTRRRQSLVAAGAVVVLTLGVFIASQYGGPASAVKRYHAVLQSAPGRLDQVTVDGLKTTGGQALAGTVRSYLRAGLKPTIQQTSKEGTMAVVTVGYPTPRGMIILLYVVRKSDGYWRVDGQASVEAMTREMGPFSG